MPTVWFLEISSFRGISLGAEHTYATLKGPKATITIERVLDHKTAAALTAKDSYTWRPGNTTNRFDTADDARAAALAAWQSVADPKTDVLIIGRAAYLDPQPLLAGPPGFIAAGQDLANQFEDLHRRGGWDKHSDEMDALTEQWEKLLGAWGLRTAQAARSGLPQIRELAVERTPEGGWRVRPSTQD